MKMLNVGITFLIMVFSFPIHASYDEQMNVCVGIDNPVHNRIAQNICHLYDDTGEYCHVRVQPSVVHFHDQSKTECHFTVVSQSLAQNLNDEHLVHVRTLEKAQSYVIVTFDHQQDDDDVYRIAVMGEYSDVHLELLQGRSSITLDDNVVIESLPSDVGASLEVIKENHINALVYVYEEYLDGDFLAEVHAHDLSVVSITSPEDEEERGKTLTVFYDRSSVDHIADMREISSRLREMDVFIASGMYVPVSIYAQSELDIFFDDVVEQVRVMQQAHLRSTGGFSGIVADINEDMRDLGDKSALYMLIIQAKIGDYNARLSQILRKYVEGFKNTF